MIDTLLFLCVLFSPFLLTFFAVLICMIFGIDPARNQFQTRNKEMYMIIRPLLKDVIEENELHNKMNNFIKDMKFNVAKSCFSCKHIRKYKVKTGALSKYCMGVLLYSIRAEERL